MTALRMAVTERAQDCDGDMEMDEDVIRHEVLIKTDMKEVLHRALSFFDEQSEMSEELYFLQLEAVWVLIDFSLGSESICEYLI